MHRVTIDDPKSVLPDEGTAVVDGSSRVTPRSASSRIRQNSTASPQSEIRVTSRIRQNSTASRLRQNSIASIRPKPSRFPTRFSVPPTTQLSPEPDFATVSQTRSEARGPTSRLRQSSEKIGPGQPIFSDDDRLVMVNNTPYLELEVLGYGASSVVSEVELLVP